VTPDLRVPGRVLPRLEAGASDLSAVLLGADMPPGPGVVRLVRRSGDALGLAVVDSDHGVVRVMTHVGEAFDTLDAAFAEARVAAAWDLRGRLGLHGAEAAHRLLHGAGDGVPGVAIDRFGAWAAVHVASRALWPLAGLVAAAAVRVCGLRGAVMKLRERGAAAQQRLEQEVIGEAPPERLVVAEGPRRFEVHLETGVNVGLFTDMRRHRDALAPYAAGRDVLNLFAYTGAFSVAAALAGARSVTSVDLSSGVLAWAGDNLRLNGIDPDGAAGQRAAQDVRRFVEAAAADPARRYGLVLVDPPSYSTARDGAFSIERDYPTVIAGAARVLLPGGVLWLASNTVGVSLPGLAQQGLAAAGRRARILEAGGLPPDYPTALSDVEARYLQVLVLQLP
jgi:23S rRNA (cytosine1962-C5)-methyltransferase